MRIKKIIMMVVVFFTLTVSLHAKFLDESLTSLFTNIKKSFSNFGEVVAVLPKKNVAVVQFKDKSPEKGTEVIVYREGTPIMNKISGKVVGNVENMVGLISLKDNAGTVGIGDILKNNGIVIGDKVKYPKRIVFVLKSIENLSDKPVAAYDIKSYLELAVSNFPEFELVEGNTPLQPQKDVYLVNLKVFIKDASNPAKKRISVKVYSAYTHYTIGLFNTDFTLSKKMLAFHGSNVQAAGKPQPYSQGINTGIPMYPMGGQGQIPTQRYSANSPYPQYPGMPQAPGQQPLPPKPYPGFNAKYNKLAKPQKKAVESKYKLDTFEKVNPVVTKFRKIAQIPEKLKSIDFYKDKIIYTDGYSIIYGKLLYDKFQKISGDLYKGFGSVLSVQFVDVDNDGKMDVVANVILKDGMDSRIYKIKNNSLILVGKGYDYIFGTFDFNDDGKPEFAGQSFDDEEIFGPSLYKLKFTNGKIEKIKRTWIPFGFRILSATKADLNGDGKKEIIFINENHRLMVFSNGEKIYEGDESLGGSFNTATVNLGTEKFEYTKARGIDVRPVKFIKDIKGRESVLIVKNYATLDAVLGDMGLFKEGELRMVYSNELGDVSVKPYTGKIEGGVEGFEIYNNEIICAVIKKSAVNPLATKAASYLIAFPAYKK